MKITVAMFTLFVFPCLVQAQLAKDLKTPVLANLFALKKAGLAALASDESLGVGYALLTKDQKMSVSQIMHDQGRCGGFEVLPFASLRAGQDALSRLATHERSNYSYQLKTARDRTVQAQVTAQPLIESALAEASELNIQKTVQWLSSFPSRYDGQLNPNTHVVQLEAQLKELLKDYKGRWSVDSIAHNQTQQNSIRVHLEGAVRPSEILIFGAHLDSVGPWISAGSKAPGADDNASGSASILEALRIVTKQPPSERTLEFFWYAAEESGLIGSSEIASQYKAEGKNVISVLQLDMTMFPGSGELVIASIEDFTSAWLRDYLVSLNLAYLNVRLISDRCGYGCSDHASWYRQGYPTLLPFESHSDDMNPNIHSERDVIHSKTSFKHTLIFTKIAIAMALDLGNSQLRQPF